MTISTTDSRISYNGNGVTTVFSFPYRFLTNGDIVVVSVSSTGVETVKTLTTDYTLTGAGDDAGGSVTMLVAPASGTRLIIYRDTDITQETDYISGDPFPAETHERALDRLTMIAQEIGSDADRSIKVPVGDSSSLSTTLPAAANRLDRLLAFDSATGEVELSGITQTQIASAVAAAYAAGSTADAVTFLQAGTGAVSESVQVALRRFVHIDQFGAVGDGTTDDLTPLTRFFESAIANPGVPHWLGNKIYACSGALPTINVSGVKIYGTGPSSNHDLGSINCSCIKKIGASGGTMLTVSATAGAGNQRLDGIVIDGVAFNGGQLAAKGLLIVSVRNSIFRVYVEECTTSNVEMNVVATLGEAPDVQDCTFHIYGRCMFTTGACLRLLGDVNANVSLNRFDIVDVVHKDGTAIICQNPDNNIWGMVRVYRATGGTATNSIEWQGGASAALATRAETFQKLTTTVAAIAKGTGTYTVAATDIRITTLDTENGTPAPTVETGASVAGPQISWTPVVTPSSGSITSYSATGLYRLDPNDSKVVNIRLSISMTNNGTGSGVIQVTLPFAAADDAVAGVVHGYEGVGGKSLVGNISVTSSTLRVSFYNATYPGATGNALTLSGSYRRA
jgi:hypothetical protein